MEAKWLNYVSIFFFAKVTVICVCRANSHKDPGNVEYLIYF